MRQRSHFRNRRCLAKCRRRLGRAFALKPAEEASSSRSQSAAAVPDIDAPSRTVRPPFRLFDPFSARLLRFQPNGSSMAPVRTSVATEFNPGEQRYHTINLLFQSIGNSAARGKRVERGDVRDEAPTPLRTLRSLRRKKLKESGRHVES